MAEAIAHTTTPTGAVLRAVVVQVGIDIPDEAIDQVSRSVEGLPWVDALRQGAGPLGLRVHVVDASIDEVAALARPDLPLLMEAEDGSVWMLEGSRWGLLHVRSLEGLSPLGWMRGAAIRERLGLPEVVTWVRVEPLLPATPLGAQAARGASPTARLASLLQAERSDIGVVAVYGVAIGVLSLATPLAIQVLINWLAFGALAQPVIVLGATLLLLLLLKTALRVAQRLAVEVVQRRIFVRTVADLAARLARVRVDSFDEKYGPELANRFFDVLTLQKATRTLLVDGLTAALQSLVGLLLLAFYHPVLLAFDVAVVALVAFVLFPLGRGGVKTAIKESKAKYEVAGWIEEVARHPLVFKLAGARIAEARAQRLTRAYLKARVAHFQVFLRQFVGMQLVQVAVNVGVLVLCGLLVLEGELTLGQLVAAEFVVASALNGVTKFTDKLETVYDLLAGVDKLGTLLDLPLDRAHGAVREPGVGPAAVALQGVAFGWPGGSTVLREASLMVRTGDRLAIVGGAGSGKSTVADLLLCVRQPTRGLVLRDDVPASVQRLDALFAEAAVLRAGELIDGTIRDNVALERAGLDDAVVWEALRACRLEECISRLPDGLDTPMVPSGRPLSENEARALLVVRALVSRPRLLVVDGLLDELSAEWRDVLLPRLLDRRAPWTLIVLTEDATIAHRLRRVVELRSGELHERPRLQPL